MYNRFVKRFFDAVLSFVGIIVFALPMLIVALILKIDSPGPVFFKQKRFGIHKSYFTILKFRSMPVTAPKDVPTDEFNHVKVELTPFQKFIRKSSIDELPQLFCIFAGHMSIVGPRPALWNQYELIDLRDKYGANDVKPGLTGWAQINGRDELGDEIKAKFDGEYVEKQSFLFDCKCFFGTVVPVLRCKNVRVSAGMNYEEKPEESKK
ncbi:MAG: sugar transferase [Clostridia bacterium]|nr:sugar transferase [Clostridia bacterium]